MGPNPNGPRSVSCDRAIRYSGFFGVRSVGPVEDFLDLTQCVLFLFSLGKSRFAVSRFAALCASFFFLFSVVFCFSGSTFFCDQVRLETVFGKPEHYR